MRRASPGGSGVGSDGTRTKRRGLLPRHRDDGGDMENDQIQHQLDSGGN